MSRFGTEGTIYYSTTDTLTSGTFIYLTPNAMPQFPMEEFQETDAVTLTTLTGRKFQYQNYRLQGYKFKWTDLPEATKNRIGTMINSIPLLSFNTTGYNTLGTFRVVDGSYEANETRFELYDVAFDVIGTSSL